MYLRIRLAGLCGIDAAILCAARPDVGEVRATLCAPGKQVRTAGADQVLAGLAGAATWLVALWLAIGLLASVIAMLPGALGRFGLVVSRAALPRALRQLIAGSVGLGILVAPVAATAAAHGDAARHAITGSALPSPSWPVDPPRGPGSLPPPLWPGSAPPDRAPRPDATSSELVRVRPGDSLWSIAARRLGGHAAPADVAATWPRWYAANRATVGPDPALIRPGELLRAPEGRR